MAAVSAWAKPGAWALDAEEHEAAMELQKEDKGYDSSDSTSNSHQQPSADFPSLAASAAAASKTSKKKKNPRLSLAEFTTGNAVTHGAGRLQSSSSSKSLTPDELLVLPTGPRERSAEELERSTRGFGYSSYGGGAGGRGRIYGEDSNSRWGSSRVSDEPRRGGYGGPGAGSNRDLGPSRADETDDWGAAKKSVVPERRERGGGFFDSQSRADESNSWISNKSAAPPSDGRRTNGGGFDGPRERRGGFEMFNREGSNGGPDSDTWGKKREDVSTGGRPRLVLQPRTLPVADGSNGELSRGEQPKGSTEKSKGSNPFGDARPREAVLAEKGQDWKKIDEKLEARSTEKSKGTNPFGEARPRGEVLVEKGQDWKKIDEKLEVRSTEKSKGMNPFGEAPRPRGEVLVEKGQDWKKIDEKLEARSTEKSKGTNPFGAARPREEVLADKGQDWKKIDEKLGSMKIREAPPEKSSFGKRGLGIGNGTGSLSEDRAERSWRKADTTDATPPSPRVEKIEDGLSN